MLHSTKVEAKFDKRNPSRLVREQSDDEKNEEEVLLEQDIEGSRPKQKRNVVKLDFDSDSNSDGESNAINEQIDEEDDDMFGELSPQKDDDHKTKNSKKKARFLDVDSFEKRLGEMEPGEHKLLLGSNVADDEKMNLTRMELDNNSQSDDDDDDEVNESNIDIDYFVNPDEPNDPDNQGSPNNKVVSAKKHEPKLEKFNLQDDMEEGQFDEEGTFIRTAQDLEAHQDQWLSGVTKRDINKARVAHLHRLQEENELNTNVNFIPKADLLATLIDRLDIGENPLEAMARMTPKRKHVSGKNKKLLSQTDAKSSLQEIDRKKMVETITESCEKLLSDHGINDIYDLTREQLSRLYQKDTGTTYAPKLKRKRSFNEESEYTNDNLTQKAIIDPDTQWEFKWQGSDQIYGPYSSTRMADWDKFNYFNNGAEVRKVNDNNFVSVNSIDWAKFHS